MSSFLTQQSVERIEAQVRSVEEHIAKTDVEILKVNEEIANVVKKIESIVEKLESTELSADERADLRDDKKELRNKEAQLRDEKKELRDEKKELRNKEALLYQVRIENASSLRGHGHISTLADGLANTVLSSPLNQGSASSFANANIKKPLRGFGHLPTSFRVDPTSDQRISRWLVPTSFEVAAAENAVLPCMGERATLAARGEDETFGVRYLLNEIAQNFPPLISSGSSMKNYKSRGAGITTQASRPDFVWMVNSKIVGILEAKDGTASALVALRQAAITAMAIVPDLRSLGLLADEIVVPVAGCTGLTIQFGAIICLEDSFGTFIATSAILDLSNLQQNQLAAAYLRKASACALETKRLISAKKLDAGSACGFIREFNTLDLVTNHYWIKHVTDEVFVRGLGLFTDISASRFDMGPGLEHMGRVLTLLYQHAEAREYVVFPLSVRSPDVVEVSTNSCECYAIVYEDLARLGYRIGSPDRLLDEVQYQRYVGAVRCAVEAIHAAGVLHCDLYPSNIMWRESVGMGDEMGVVKGDKVMKGVCGSAVATSVAPGVDRSVSIKIIDWDCAHCLAEGAFHPRIAEALAQHKPSRSADFGKEHDLRYLQVLEQDLGTDEDRRVLWQALASNEKLKIDVAFYKMYRDMPR